MPSWGLGSEWDAVFRDKIRRKNTQIIPKKTKSNFDISRKMFWPIINYPEQLGGSNRVQNDRKALNFLLGLFSARPRVPSFCFTPVGVQCGTWGLKRKFVPPVPSPRVQGPPSPLSFSLVYPLYCTLGSPLAVPFDWFLGWRGGGQVRSSGWDVVEAGCYIVSFTT